MESLQVLKVLNNNVVIASHGHYGEVVVIGRGVGFGKKAKDLIQADAGEKMFILRNQKEKELYKRLLEQVDEKLIGVMNDVIYYIAQHAGAPLNEHIHIALTDHIAFAVMRNRQGITVHNPFNYETREFYPREYKLAEHAVAEINSKLGIELPDDEIGFVALHIHSAIADRPIGEVRENSQLISDLVELIERSLGIKVERDSLNYSRLLRHLMIALERVRRGEQVDEPGKITELIKAEYPEMYSLAWTLIKVIQQRLHKPVYDAEAVFLTLHLQRIVQNSTDYK
ncbi:PtsGHI operon antiterminator [Paenibacillus sambharensis]|uniref:PtsGHI operon antiterminator n=1 Tax=Paenibacillus sambharensis TaxID=1803190 RepID=A0A2W1LRK1_9BACL|nr:transcription antiterminator [Paenibacillus sambharensis]PZD97602.1 PtsGHI operon antiterminator [Paenibacillus sambharensis]